MSDALKLQISLLAMRLGVGAVFLVWATDRVLNYSHNSKMMVHYYGVSIPEGLLTAIGIAQLAIIIAFLVGFLKRISYGYILIAHLVTTLVSAKRLFPPYEIHQLLYFGSLPMLGACLGLYLLRDKDTLVSLNKW